ncbi:bacteriophage abortive infection AbiH family protein [Rheinheimera sp. D18]|uniref:bacteriophage abortive infection AbiH family protein n=1 Tax=Rheinheimera sp. D18 TaxID=2545632 RepID=UPI001A9EEC44|nr:bacteriophage abortive infection AbiH family protein [Rheinheimera sp. D18]
MNRKLYIIGNGFDLWHGLPTSYGHFSEYAYSLLSEIENYYALDFNQYNPWHDFENALGDFDSDTFLDNYNEIDASADDFRPSFVYGLEDELTEQTNTHVDAIRDTFSEWINQIDVSKAVVKLTFPEHSLFLSFNYTSTLQTVYGVDSNCILHIHGNSENNDELIFGHGEDIHEIHAFDEDGEPTGDMFSDARENARYPLYALKKPVDDVLARHEGYFDKLRDIGDVIVIGHSMNKIDHPYFRRINQVASDATWTVVYYSDVQESDFIQSLIDCGVKPERIQCYDYDIWASRIAIDVESADKPKKYFNAW